MMSQVSTKYFFNNPMEFKHTHIGEKASHMFIYAIHILIRFWRFSKSNPQMAVAFQNVMSPQDFRDRLLKCTNLQEFRFASDYSHSMT